MHGAKSFFAVAKKAPMSAFHGKNRSLKLITAAMSLCAVAVHAEIPDQAHPSYTLREVPVTQKFRTMGLAFLPDGRMAISTGIITENPTAPRAENAVYVLSGVTGDAVSTVEVKKLADNFITTSGLVMAEGKLFVSDRDALYEIPDVSGAANPGSNKRKAITWVNALSFHQWPFSPVYFQGEFYTAFSGTIAYGGSSNQKAAQPLSGALLRAKDGSAPSAFSSGLRSPNGLGMSPSGVMMVTDNAGGWVPTSTMTHMKQGKSYGHKHNPLTEIDQWPYQPPVAWFPNGEVRDSPSQPVWVPKGIYAGQWLLGDVNNPGLMRIFTEEVNGDLQGTVFWFSRGTGIAAINRMAFGPDDALYMASLEKIQGNWPGGGLMPIYRLAPNGKTTFEVLAVRTRKGGVELEFTQPVSPANASAFAVRMWGYKRELGYEGGKQPTVNLGVGEVRACPDGKRLFLGISGLAADKLLHLKWTGVKSANGDAPWNNESWSTVNAISNSEPCAPIATAVDPEYAQRNRKMPNVRRTSQEFIDVAGRVWRGEGLKLGR